MADDADELIETKLTILGPTEATPGAVLQLPRQPGLAKLREILTPLLDGGDLEHVSVLYEGRRADMFVDDIGSLKGLPRNEVATKVYRAHWLSQHQGGDPESIPAIYGPAVIFSRRVWF